ncbi:Heterokaryon incompatibility protein (HET) domain containing protein [Hyaloscypha variabilis]
MAGTNYEYSTLPEGYFRLLTIVSVDNKEITCELENFLLEEAPEYTAFSYVWGRDPLTSEKIICDGKSLAITPHLHETIHHLHGLVPIIKVWIDAICINQADLAERAVQTRRMNSVYGSAQEVLAWLGKGDDNSDRAMDRIEDINQKLTLILQDNTPENKAFIHNWLGKDTLSSTGLQEIDDTIWHEVALAKQIVVARGKRRVEWNTLTTLATGLRRANLIGLIGGTPKAISDIKRAFLAIGTFRIAKNMVEAKHPSLLQFAAIGRAKDVTNCVDRIYGLLGLVSPMVASQVVVDYSKEWRRVYIQYSKLQLQSEPTLLLFSMSASQERPTGLPSWCPNFDSPPKDPFSLAGVIGYQAGFESWEDRLKPNVQISDSNHIQIFGFRVDYVRQVVGSPKHCFETEPSYGPSGSSALLLDYESRCLKVSQDAYNLPDKVPDAHWRTLTADADFHSRSPLPPNVLDDYERVKKLWKTQRDQTSPDPYSVKESERQGNLNYHQNWEAKRTRTFFSTRDGRVGLGPCDLQEGDVICVLYGGAPLFVLRLNDNNEAQLVGDAFVYGLMDLKSLPADKRGKDEWFTIC